LDHGLHVLKPRSFPQNSASKMRERHQLFFGLWLVSKEFQHPEIQTKIKQHFGGFFSLNKSAPVNWKTGYMQTMIATSRRLDSFLHTAAQNFEVFQIFKSEFKKSKTYSG
jgi:hypothetical protein